jgi:hypothetical protein
MPLTRGCPGPNLQECAHLPAEERSKPRGSDARFRAKSHDVEHRLGEEVHQQPQIVQQDGEAEVKQPYLERRRGCPRRELLDLAVGGLDAAPASVPGDPSLGRPTVDADLVVDDEIRRERLRVVAILVRRKPDQGRLDPRVSRAPV